MALTKVEELSILAGDIKPPTVALNELVRQIAVATAITFMSNHKIFDVLDKSDPLKPISINAKAAAYRDKLITVSSAALNIRSSISGLDKIIVSIMGASVTSAQLSGASDDQWETFIENEMFIAFELAGAVRRQEKIDYDVLP